MLNNFASMLRDEDGQGLVEYALIISLVAILCIVGLKFLSTSANAALSNAANNMSK